MAACSEQGRPCFSMTRSKLEKDWDDFSDPGSIDYETAAQAVEGILSREFIDRTIASINPHYMGSAKSVESVLVQQGRKFLIFHVLARADESYNFILVLSRGKDFRNREVKADFSNLSDLRTKLVDARLPVFVPKPYVLGEHTGLFGFSVEALDEHAEMNSLPADGFLQLGMVFPEFFINSPFPKAARFNQTQKDAFYKMVEGLRGIAQKQGKDRITDLPSLMRGLEESDYYRRTQLIQEEIIARLCVVNRLTGCVPREFSVNAGDFVANPEKEDLDLYLTTIRGGWKIMSCDLLPLWFANLTENFLYRDGSLVEYPLFHSTHVIQRGMQRGEELLRKP